MINIVHSFYGKLSLIFLILILSLGAGTLIIGFSAAGYLFDEVEQLLNKDYAASIALELKPIVVEGFSEVEIKDAIHYMMVLNPMVEIYLLSSNGNILAYFTHPKEKIIREDIDLTPLRKFVDTDGQIPVKGDDPRTESGKKPFSAAPLMMGEDDGYVYVILRGQGFDRFFELLRSSYYLSTGVSTFFLALLTTLIAGLSLFFFLTRRLRLLNHAVIAFEKGEYDYRLNTDGSDELSSLSRAFNDMATSIEKGIKDLNKAEQERSDLLTNISHDLRTPLTSVRGYLEMVLIKGNELNDMERDHFIGISLNNITSFQKLVEELFELAKLESKQMKPELEFFQLAELTQDVVMKITGKADESQIKILIDNPGELPQIKGDIGLLERVITNLLDNAINHSKKGGKIYIQFEVMNSCLHFIIRDKGCGIGDKDLEHIFERFYRSDLSRDKNYPGTGLGLAIVKEIISIHSGTIVASSPSDGGASFTISLPILKYK